MVVIYEIDITTNYNYHEYTFYQQQYTKKT